MRYKHEIWEAFMKYHEENLCKIYCEQHGKQYYSFFDDSPEVFATRLNTFGWLMTFVYPQFKREDRTFFKPSNENIVEAMQFMTTLGNNSLDWAKKYKNDPETRKSLTKMAKKRIACSEYYTDLAKSGFFDDKYIKE